MTRFIFLLKFAHAVEIGAYNAYEGHWQSLPFSSPECKRIREIQEEERYHREEVSKVLRELGYKNSLVLDALLFVIGRTISISCYCMPKRMAMWGAKLMEFLGADIYKKLAKEARDQGYPALGVTFDGMEWAEEEHEQFFTIYLVQRVESDLRSRR